MSAVFQHKCETKATSVHFMFLEKYLLKLLCIVGSIGIIESRACVLSGDTICTSLSILVL